MVVPGGVEEFEVVVAVEAKEKLEGDEALRLEIADQSSDASGKASLRKEECEPERPCLLYTSPSPRDKGRSRRPSAA